MPPVLRAVGYSRAHSRTVARWLRKNDFPEELHGALIAIPGVARPSDLHKVTDQQLQVCWRRVSRYRAQVTPFRACVNNRAFVVGPVCGSVCLMKLYPQDMGVTSGDERARFIEEAGAL